jgi:glutamine synthetase
MSVVPLTQLEVADYSLGIRGKLLRSDKLQRSGKSAFCTIVYGLDVADGVTDTPLSTAANGYPDAFAVPDEATRIDLTWRKGTSAVIADLCDEEGRPLPEAPRTVLARQVDGFSQLGLAPVLGFEYECYLLQADDEALRTHSYDRVQTVDRTISCYNISRHTQLADLIGEFIDRMDSVGIPVDAAHSELGPGFFEFALAPLPSMAAADAAVRSRQYFRDLCAERGLVATFMAKYRMDTSGSGGHVHQSLTRDGVNEFADDGGGLSATGRAYLGGLLASMSDYSAMLSPLLNSYKRIDPGSFVAARATWGWDTRSAACRVIHNAGPAATRIEHRRPGADASPYLVAAALLAGGLEGIRDNLEPGAPVTPEADLASAGAPLPGTLAEATTAFRHSARARRMLGDRFVDAYTATREAEIQAFTTWWSTTVTDWELRRYLQHL